MEDIKDTFQASPLSLLEVFQYQMGATSFRIPIYQRNFRWPKTHIGRLFEDVSDGLKSIGSAQGGQSLTFLGTAILVDENTSKEDSFDGNSLAIVDGQQRLTTLAVTLCEIHRAIQAREFALGEESPADLWLLDEASTLRQELFKSFATFQPHRMVDDPFQFIPVIVREDSDTRSTSSGTAEYQSPLAAYLIQYAQFVWRLEAGETELPFEFHPLENSQRQTMFNDRRGWIIDNISNLLQPHDPAEDTTTLPAAPDLVVEEAFRKLFAFLRTRHKEVIRTFRGVREAELRETQRELIKLLTFGSYLLERVAVTFVSVQDERYAFDIFEALNTTGESLTAIETFKPLVISYEDRQRDTRKGFQGSETQQRFEEVERYIYGTQDSRAQQRRSQDLVVLLALYAEGARQSNHLSAQRRYLRVAYEAVDSAQARQRFVRLMADLVDFQSRFWRSGEFTEFVNLGAETQLCYCCLSLISEMKTTMAIPLLTRYWEAAWETGAYEYFVEAVKAVTAFIVLRRSATGDTANIDRDFRTLMNRGSRSNDGSGRPFCAGLGEEPNPLPPVSELTYYLRDYLAQSRVGVTNMETWVNRMARQPLKTYSNPLCRFLLLAAARHGQPRSDNPYLLEAAHSEPALDFLSWEVWAHDDFQSIEHVAPESGGEGWSPDIFNDPNLRHTVGNLALLPNGANAAVGNAGPERKWLMYQALAARDVEEAEHFIEQANVEGIPFTNRLKEIIRSGRRVPGVAGIGLAPHWNQAIIEERARNIGHRVWEEISPWLGFEISGTPGGEES